MGKRGHYINQNQKKKSNKKKKGKKKVFQDVQSTSEGRINMCKEISVVRDD